MALIIFGLISALYALKHNIGLFSNKTSNKKDFSFQKSC